MWTFEHTLETDASPQAVWRLYADVTTWPRWNGAVQHVELDGTFGPGATGRLTPRGQGELPFKIVAAAEDSGYTSETQIADTVVLRLTNSLSPLCGGGTRMTHHAVFDGEAADFFGQSFGPMIASGIPVAMKTLAQMALQHDEARVTR